MKLFSLIVAFVLFVAIAVAIEFRSLAVSADYQPLPESRSDFSASLVAYSSIEDFESGSHNSPVAILSNGLTSGSTGGELLTAPRGVKVCRLRLVRITSCRRVWIGSLGVWSQECKTRTESRCD